MAANLAIIIKAHDQASRVLAGVEKQAGGLGSKFAALGKVAAIGAGAGIVALGGILASSVKEAMESQKAIAQLEAVLKSTGGSAGVTKKQMLDMASAFQKTTAFSDEAVLGAQNILLTFTKIKGPEFQGATQAVLDMSTALGTDLQSASIQVGKALNDPILGMTALRRAGVSFTADQVKQVKAMVAAGDALGAQKLILKELSTEFGGSAAKAADTFGGRMARLKNAVSEIQERIGFALLPILSKLAELFSDALPAVEAFANKGIGAVTGAIKSLVGEAGALNVLATRLALILDPSSYGDPKKLGGFLNTVRTIFVALGNSAPVKALISLLKDNLQPILIGLGVTAAILIGAFVAPFVLAAAKTALMISAISAVIAVLAKFEQRTGFFRKKLIPELIDFGKTVLKVGTDVGRFLAPALDTLRDAWVNLGRPLAAVVLPILGKIGQFLLDHKPLLIAIAAAILLITNPWLAVAAAIVVVLAKWDEISAFFIGIGDAITGFIDKVKEIPIIGAIFEDTWNTAIAAVELAVKLIWNRVKFLFESIQNAFKFWKAIFTGDWDGAWKAVRAQAAAIWNLIKGDFGALLDAFKGILSSKLELLKTVGSDIGNAIGDGLKAAAGALKQAMNALIGIVESGINLIVDAWNDLSIKLPKVDLGPLGSVGGQKIDFPDIPRISLPRLQAGTPFWRGGLAMLGEAGREIAALPRGTEVLNNRQTERMLASAGGSMYFAPGAVIINTTDRLDDPATIERFWRGIDSYRRRKSA